MINSYVKKLIENLPDDFTKQKSPLVLDLVLDGGAFNGNYLVGALYFLKEMEKRGYIKVDRISGCSIGSFVGLIYFLDDLDSMSELNSIMLQNLKATFLFNKISYVLESIKNKFPKDICNRLNNRLFISYNNITTKKIVKCKYKSADDVVQSILKSVFIPFPSYSKLTPLLLYFTAKGKSIFELFPLKNTSTLTYFCIKGTTSLARLTCPFPVPWMAYKTFIFFIK